MPAMLEASRDIGADLICLDLEDGTAPAQKIEARHLIRDYLQAGRPKAREILVRVNALDTEWGLADLQFAAGLGVDGILLPKVEGDGTVRQARSVLDGATSNDRPALWCLVETALGILRVEQIAAAGVEGLVVGGFDLSESLRVRQMDTRNPLLYALGRIVLAARALELCAIDGLHHNFLDMVAIEAATRQSADLGFDGKMVFSAETAAIANRTFRPTAEEIAKAQKLLTDPSSYGAHLDHARSVLEIARMADAVDAAT
jgi:citrate lyase subunit beta / citryl-CoA lyase